MVANACGTRDPFEYGTLQLHSLDTNHVSHTRCYDKLLPKAIGVNSPSWAPVVAVLASTEGLFKDSRAGRTERVALNSGAVGESTKERNDRVLLTVDDGPDRDERRYTLLMAFQMSLGEKARFIMDAVTKRCPDFDLRATQCLKAAKNVSSKVKEIVLPDGSRSIHHVIGEDHLLGTTPEQVEEGKEWIAGVVEGLEKDEITCQDWCRFSVVTALGCNFNSACLRERAALGLAANTSYVQEYDKFEDRENRR